MASRTGGGDFTRRVPEAIAVHGVLIGALLVTLLAVPRPCPAAAPQLVIQLTGGGSASYGLEEILRLDVEAGQTLVVVTPGGADDYPAGSIARIEFLWSPTAVAGPLGASQGAEALHLFQNLPNPFSARTRIDFDLPRAGDVELAVYAPNGRRIRTLTSGARPAGRETVFWDGLDDAGHRVASGIYLYRLRAPGLEEHQRMILLH